jgi:hypothetical protein
MQQFLSNLSYDRTFLNSYVSFKLPIFASITDPDSDPIGSVGPEPERKNDPQEE